VTGHVTVWRAGKRAVQRSIFLTVLDRQRVAQIARKPTLHNPITGWDWPSEAATANSAFLRFERAMEPRHRSRGRNWQSARRSERASDQAGWLRAQSSAASIPASGPGKIATPVPR
jgi:hypothetical protein